MSALRTVFVELPAWTWVGILLARLAVGSAFFLSGRGKLFVNERGEQMRQTLREAHIPFPELNAVFVSTIDSLAAPSVPRLSALTIPMKIVRENSLLFGDWRTGSTQWSG